MRRNTSNAKRPAKRIVAVVVCIAVLMLTVGVPAAATARGATTLTTIPASSHTIIVKPNGVDDTANIQAAFNTCTSHNWVCTIELVKGTYYTEQITVYGFRGSFVGAGQGATIVQAQPNLPPPNTAYATNTIPFWAGLPGPSNPWPVLFTFVNGAFGISGMTIGDTYANPVQAFNYFGEAYTGLWSSILVTGEAGQFVTAAVDHVTINGGPGMNLGFNDNDEIAFEGLLLPSGWTNPWSDTIPLSGSFSVTNSVFHNVSTGPFFFDLRDSTGVACFNTVTTSASLAPYVLAIPFGFYDLSNSQLVICGNHAVDVPGGAGVIGYQSWFKSDLLPSTVYITGNDFLNLSGDSYGYSADGVFLWDAGATSTLSAVVSGNVMQTNTSCGCYGTPPFATAAIETISLASVVVRANLLLGGAGVLVAFGPGTVSGNLVLGNIEGVELDSASDVSVTGNVITNSANYGIALFTGSSDNTIAYNVVKGSALFDLFWDGSGVGNVWTHNMCTTSSPPGLC